MNTEKFDLFSRYYAHWIKVYKEGAIRKVTMQKHLMTLTWVEKLAPDLLTEDLTRTIYQQLLNDYAEFQGLSKYLI